MTLIISALSAIFYRLGGIGKPFSGRIRDWGCSLLVVGWCWFNLPHVAWYLYLLSFGLMWMALTTYHDYIGFDSFYMHGFFVGLALLPIVPWMPCLLRSIVLGISMGLWCKYFSNDWIEEFFRGGSIIFTLPILLI